jgi:hemin uptake protein HemP
MQFDSQNSGKSPGQTTQDRKLSIRNGEIDSRELFQSERVLIIRHGDETYRLRLTGLNKLILTK